MIKPIIRFLTRPFFLLLPVHSQEKIRLAFNRDFKKERRNKLLRETLLEHAGAKVASGPFAGISYVTKAVNSAYCPKILGSYEKELWPAVEEIIYGNYKQVIDIGAAEGYYAVGLAVKTPNAKIIAFESDTFYHRLLKKLARLNAVEQRIVLYGTCAPQDLNRLLTSAGKTAIICDIEGAEMELMDPNAIPLLRNCDLLIETHDFARPGIADFLRRAFERTHTITTIKGRDRNAGDWPLDEKIAVPKELRGEMLDEQRNGVEQEWLWIKTNAPVSH